LITGGGPSGNGTAVFCCDKSDMKNCYCSFFSDIGWPASGAVIAFEAGWQTDRAAACSYVRTA
jgi:hypothetical protein